ncbi:MAG: hypothetical protein FWG69_05660 [Oscillospiraceae bacterium]|nr:hypothetical protein [Oscillospiraceae bacterium]
MKVEKILADKDFDFFSAQGKNELKVRAYGNEGVRFYDMLEHYAQYGSVGLGIIGATSGLPLGQLPESSTGSDVLDESSRIAVQAVQSDNAQVNAADTSDLQEKSKTETETNSAGQQSALTEAEMQDYLGKTFSAFFVYNEMRKQNIRKYNEPA